MQRDKSTKEYRKLAIVVPQINAIKVQGVFWNDCIETERVILKAAQYTNPADTYPRNFLFIVFELKSTINYL